MEPQRKIADIEAQLIRDAEFRHGEYLASLNALAGCLITVGLREVRVAITEAEASGLWLQNAAWQLARIDGPLRADRAWEYRED